MHNAISRLFNLLKIGVADAGDALRTRVFTPLYNNVLEPALDAIKPYVKTALTTLNDWTFKPLFKGLGDCFHGIYTAAVVDECSVEELEENLVEFYIDKK